MGGCSFFIYTIARSSNRFKKNVRVKERKGIWRDHIFPMFVDLTGKKVLMAGGGKIALRRVKTLLSFGAIIHVTAPELCEELSELERQGKITAEHREYQPGDTSRL